MSSTSFFLCAHAYFSVVQIHATRPPMPLPTVTHAHLPTPAFPPCPLTMCTCLCLLHLCLCMCMLLHLHVFTPIHLPPCTVVPAPACLHAWVGSLYFFFLNACAHSKSSLPPSLSGSCHPNTTMGNVHMSPCNSASHHVTSTWGVQSLMIPTSWQLMWTETKGWRIMCSYIFCIK